MNENMQVVPNIISGKDLDYLSDMFNWNYCLLKKSNHYVEEVQDDEIKNMISRVVDDCSNNLNEILNILNMKGSSYE